MTCDSFTAKAPGSPACKNCGDQQASHAKKVPPPAPAPRAAPGPPHRSPPGPPAKMVVHSPKMGAKLPPGSLFLPNIVVLHHFRDAPPDYDDLPSDDDDGEAPPEEPPPNGADDDSDDDDTWEEFRSGSAVIMVNLKTRAVRLASDAVDDVAKPAMVKARRNSAIFQGAWTEDKKPNQEINTHDDDDPDEDIIVDEDEDDDDEYGPPSDDPDDEEFGRDSRGLLDCRNFIEVF